MKKHGGDIYTYREQTGNTAVNDFSANINPFGVPGTVRQAITDSVSKLIHYPDPENRMLIKALSEFHGTDIKYFVCGNGGADIIWRTAAALSPSKSLIASPTFSEYSDALENAGSEVNSFVLKYPFVIDEDFVREAENPDYDLIVICNPNNPTGTVTGKKMITDIVKAASKNGARVLLDECFFDMTGADSEINSMISLVSEYPGLIIVKSMTKMYALPGIRLGYAISSDTELINKIKNTGQPWPVNTLAAEAGAAALSDTDYRNNFIRFICEERRFLYSELKRLGFEVWEPGANFIFFRAEGFQNLDSELLKYGIMIRSCSNYHGLNDEFFRICVRKREDNLYLLGCLEKIINERN